MNFTSNDLTPFPLVVPIKRVNFSLPLTPFFMDRANSANQRTLGFHGDDFYLQFKSSGPYVVQEDAEIFCGFASYRTFTSDDLNEAQPESSASSGTRTKSYVFDRDANQVRLATVEDGHPTIGNIWPDSPTTATQGNPNNDPPDHITITLSDAVGKDWLTGEFQRWMNESDDFRNATGGGLGTYSYIGPGATRSESDGHLGIIGGGDVVAFGPWFSGVPFGMVGDEGEKWNGKFSSWVNRVRRKNAPVIHAEVSMRDGFPDSGGSNLAAGHAIYQEGYAEMELTDPIEDLWMDGHGVYHASAALNSFPMSAASTYDFYGLISHTGDGEANELTLVSRTGRRYRVTIQTGRNADEWLTSQSYVITTDQSTLQATLTLEEDEDAWDVRVARIEEELTIDNQTQWQVVADIESFAQYQSDMQVWQNAWDAWNSGDRVGAAPVKPTEQKHPAALSGPDVGGGFLILAAMKTRSGSRFGFSPLVYSNSTAGDRYRKRTFKLHLTPGTVEPNDGTCGLTTITGSADLEWSEEFDNQTGLQLPRNVGQWQLSIAGKDWTQESYGSFDSVNFYGSTPTIETTTKIRREGSRTWTGRFLVAFDAPDRSGKVLSSEWTKVAMSVTDEQNHAAAVALDPPASGESLFFEGHRLTYADDG
jgi:hypothetical protein